MSAKKPWYHITKVGAGWYTTEKQLDHWKLYDIEKAYYQLDYQTFRLTLGIK